MGFTGHRGRLFFSTLDAAIDWYASHGLLSTANRGIIPDGAFQGVLRGRGNKRKFPIAFLLGSFISETDAGADAFSNALVARLTREKSRLGLDSILASAILHLQARGAASAGGALALWRATPNTAHGLGFVYDRKAGQAFGLADTQFEPNTGLFGRGVQLSQQAQDLASMRGGDLMNTCELGFKIAGGLIGAGIGAAIGGGSGAKKGGEAGLLVGEIAGDIICGWGNEAPVEIDNGKGGAPGIGDEGTTTVFNPGSDSTDVGGFTPGAGEGGQSKNQTDISTGGSATEMHETTEHENTTENNSSGDGSGDGNPPKDDNGGWPNPEQGYPAPDDGGGTPWSSVGLSNLPTLHDMTRLGLDLSQSTLKVGSAVQTLQVQLAGARMAANPSLLHTITASLNDQVVKGFRTLQGAGINAKTAVNG